MHDNISLQALIDASQYELAAEHLLAPHKQVAVFGSFPLIFVHSGADRQRQETEEEVKLQLQMKKQHQRGMQKWKKKMTKKKELEK